jgi:chromosome segregation ATPase
LRCAFAHPASDIADYKVARIYEARINAEPDPYNADDLIARRQAARDRIDTLKKEIRELRGEAEETPSEEAQKAQELNELDTGYERAKNQILMAYVAAVMADDADTQASLKAQLKELDADYDAQRKG